MVPEQDYQVVDAMEKFGGSFVKALAEALRQADFVNYNKLKKAFPNYFNYYRGMINKN